MSTLKIEAIRARCEADMLEAKAVLEIYLMSSVGVGEHPQILEEIEKQLLKYNDAHGKLQALQDIVRVDESPVADNTGEK